MGWFWQQWKSKLERVVFGCDLYIAGVYEWLAGEQAKIEEIE